MKGKIVPQTLPWPIRWKVDFDYLESLSEDEKKWLADFVAAHYDGDFRDVDRRVWNRRRRRESWREKKSARVATIPGTLFRDLLLLPPDESVEEQTTELDESSEETGAYLDTPEYKEARDRYRSDPSEENRRLLELHTGRGQMTDAESWALRDLEAWMKLNCR